jgi:hypothetical protein
LNNVKSKNSFQLIVNSIVKSNLKKNDLALKVFLNVINSNHEKFVVVSELFFFSKLTFFLLIFSKTICLRGITNLILNSNLIYGIRNPSHPFVMCLRNLNDCFDYIFEEIKYIHKIKSIDEAICLLKPVYLHIFLEKCKLKHVAAKYLIEIILKTKNSQNNDNVVYLIHLYLAHLTVIKVLNIL